TTVRGDNSTYTATEETPSYTEGGDDIVTKHAVEKEPTKEPEVENVEKEPESTSRQILITIVRPLTKTALEHEMIGSSSRIQLTDTILEPDRGKGKITKDEESPPKLVKTSRKVQPDPDAPIVVVHEEATKAGVDPKILASAKGGQEFIKIQDAKIKVHSNRLKPKTITDVKIHPNTKPVAMKVLKGTNKRNFD
ncbi:hypothetical protein Tco_0114567, partial [Tanacetum coccineum]